MDVKKYLIEILDYYKYKVENDLCNLEEMNSVIRSLEENAKVTGTISDFARFFNVPETTVRTNIFRKMFSKPKRKVLYSFSEFLKIVPARWRNNK
jgi:hypothetical protein